MDRPFAAFLAQKEGDRIGWIRPHHVLRLENFLGQDKQPPSRGELAQLHTLLQLRNGSYKEQDED